MTKHSLSVILLAAGWLCVAGCTGSATTPQGIVPTPTGPQATMVSDSEIQAGEVEYGLQRDYVFRIQNTGGSPLTLTTTHKSCQCAESEVPESIAPGQEGAVKIRWGPIPGGKNSVGVGNTPWKLKVQTNEPRELTFLVKANIKSKVRVLLPDRKSFIDFGDTPLQPGMVYTREVKVFSPDLINFNLEARCSVEGFTVVKTPLPPDSRIGDTIARSGYVVSLSSTNKLPPGYIHGELTLTMTAEGEPDRKIAVDVYANRSNSDFKVATEGGQIVFKNPTITAGESKDVLIQFDVPSPGDKLELVSFEPKWLMVAAPVRKNDKGLWQISVRIPADNAEARAWQALHFMEGQIVLKSNRTASPVAIRLTWDPPETPKK